MSSGPWPQGYIYSRHVLQDLYRNLHHQTDEEPYEFLSEAATNFPRDGEMLGKRPESFVAPSLSVKVADYHGLSPPLRLPMKPAIGCDSELSFQQWNHQRFSNVRSNTGESADKISLPSPGNAASPKSLVPAAQFASDDSHSPTPASHRLGVPDTLSLSIPDLGHNGTNSALALAETPLPSSSSIRSLSSSTTLLSRRVLVVTPGAKLGPRQASKFVL
ncbi:hypothetical protein C8J57DRAFT_1223726 [Mycena rebaudengoi]|nr:hypothetical protein C8J57DRAFT_1223726 [Mycena rebaudengoi]